MNELATTNASAGMLSPMHSPDAFVGAWKMATALAKSSLIPQAFQDKPENVVIAMDMAQRIGAGLFSVMQSLHIIHGKPGFSAQFLIATLNASGAFTRLQFEFERDDARNPISCRAFAKEIATGQTLYGPSVSIAMAKAEGWYSKNGSKWPTMPELMLSYRAAAFFIRINAPGISLGLPTADEVEDTVAFGADPGKPGADRTVTSILEVRRKSETHEAQLAAIGAEARTADGVPFDTRTGEVVGAAPAPESKPAPEPSAKPAPEQEGKEAAPAANPAEPQAQPANASGSPPQAATAGTGDFGADLTPGQVRMVRNKAAGKGLTQADVVAGIGGQINKATLNDALKWIDDQSGTAATA